MTSRISLLIGYADVNHVRINGTMPKCPLHFRQIHVPTHHVSGESVFQNVRMALVLLQARVTSYLTEYPIELGALRWLPF